MPTDLANVLCGERAVVTLTQNCPNPFNPFTQITFSVGVPGEVRLSIYDVAGRLLRTMANGWHEPGVYIIVWDGRDDDGRALPSGIYLYRLEAKGFALFAGRFVLGLPNAGRAFRFSLGVGTTVRLTIFDVEGRLLRTLLDDWCEPGAYAIIWDGKDDDGTVLRPGVYFYRLEYGRFMLTRKMVLLH
jgi:hypothetical protein